MRSNTTDTLIVRASATFHFVMRNQEGFDYLMRYFNGEPLDIAEFETIDPFKQPHITVDSTLPFRIR